MSASLVLSLADACAQLRVEVGDDDAMVLAATASAQDHFEASTGCFMTTRTLTAFEYEWPVDGFRLVAYPVIGARVFYRPRDAVADVQVPPADLIVRRNVPGPALLQPVTNAQWPDDWQPGSEIRLEIDCGFPGGTAPAGAVQAVRFLLGHFYKHREAVATGGAVAEVPLGAAALMAPFRQLLVV